MSDLFGFLSLGMAVYVNESSPSNRVATELLDFNTNDESILMIWI